MPTVLNCNLFDSVANEVEKITSYELMFSRLSPSQTEEAKLLNYDDDIVGFMYCNNSAILTDKILRSFIDMEYAVKRNYEESIKQANNYSIAKYNSSLLELIENHINRILTMIKRKQIYNDSVIENTSVIDLFKSHDSELRSSILGNSNCAVIASSDYADTMNKSFGRIKELFLSFRIELESKPYLRQAYFIIKHMILVCLEMSYVHSTVSFE